MAINKLKKGFGVIEILVVVFLVVLGLGALFGFTVFSLSIANLNKQTAQANGLAIETIETIRNFRDGTDWNSDGLGTLSLGIDYYLQNTESDPPEWEFIQGKELIDGFERSVVFSQVFRDSSSGNIADSGNNDSGTKRATITVSFGDRKVELITYFTNWR